MDNRDKRLACYRIGRASLVGAGLLSLPVVVHATLSQADGFKPWAASHQTVAFCTSMTADELQAAIDGGECLDFLKNVDTSVAPGAGLADAAIASTPDAPTIGSGAAAVASALDGTAEDPAAAAGVSTPDAPSESPSGATVASVSESPGPEIQGRNK